MPQIGIADKQTLDNTKTVVDTINTKVGTNADVAGTTTVFARVKQIYEYMVNTLLVAINGRQASWGAVAGTKTNIDNTAATVGTINTKVGVSTDTSATASLFGRLKQIWDKVSTLTSGTNFNSLYRSSSDGSFGTPGATVLNITGAGYLLMAGSTANNLQFVVDGTTHYVGIVNTVSTILRFNSSLIVRCDSSTPSKYFAHYILD